MKARSFDPLRLDVEAFAKQAARLEGDWPLADMARIVETTHPQAVHAGADAVHWQARGESRPVRGAPPQTWLHLQANARVALECQRCLEPVQADLQAERSFLFVHGEETAAALDADSEDDVLALTHALDLRSLVEDELLLSMPLVPRHEICPQPLPVASDEVVAADPPPHPFAALAALKGRSRPN
jgi:uncharacterized protein